MMVRLVVLFCLMSGLLVAGPAAAQSTQEREIAREVLSGLQEKSIRQSREFCGMIGKDAFGRFVVGPVSRGSAASCRYRPPRSAVEIVATFHTHGGYLRGYDNEVPSILDLVAERSLGTRGYVSTPGGRFWIVDGPAETATLICGPKCLPWDPKFTDGNFGPVQKRFTGRELLDRAQARPSFAP